VKGTKGFIVSFPDVGGDTAAHVHRVRNWAEDLWHEAHDKGWGIVENADTATDRVSVAVANGRKLGDMSQAIRRSLRKHNLLKEALIAKAPTSGRRRTSG
jgi:hypothetical protein